MIDFGQGGHTEALEDMQRLGPLLRVVEDDVDDRTAERLARGVMVNEDVFKSLLVTKAARDSREGRIEALVAFDHLGQ